ncbi:MAG TPA: erythromycin esterase family protein [Natronosporangium sp.]
MSIDITDLAQPFDPAAVWKLLPNQPRLLALGEPTHGEADLLDLRNELFQYLVEQAGYRTIAIESDCLMGLVVDGYVTTGAGELDEVMVRGLSHGFGDAAGNRELVRWLRSYNQGRPAAEQVHFAGFDGPLEITGAASPRQALTGLYGYLAARVDPELLPCDPETLDRLIGADDRWPNPAAMMDPGASVGRTPDAARLRLIADDLVALLDTELPRLAATSAPAELELARLHGRTAIGLLRYHRRMADRSPGRMASLLAQRAAMMAENLLALADRGPTLVFAHNAHLQRTKSSLRMGEHRPEWWSAGAIVSNRLGDRYAFLATAIGTIRHRGVDTPPPDTVEGLMYGLPADRSMVDAGRLAARCGDSVAARESPWFGYAGLDPAHLAGIDGLLFIKDLTAR